MSATLYVLRGAHPSRSAILMLRHKGIAFREVPLLPGLHPVLVRALGFQARAQDRTIDGSQPPMLRFGNALGTVPSLRIDGRRVSTNHAIARHLDALQPDPCLLPTDPAARARVEEAERWADDELQMTARRLVITGGRALRNDGADGRLGPLLFKSTALRLRFLRFIAAAFAAPEHIDARLYAELPGMLDRVDAWIEAGVLNGERLNVADFMVAPSLALLCYRPDAAAEIARRPAARLVDRLLPEPKSATARR